MPKPQPEAETARLEARVPVQVYDQLQRAARLRGMTLTGYLIATAGEDARRVVEEADIMRLARDDQIRFAEARGVNASEYLNGLGGGIVHWQIAEARQRPNR
jgi:uncharacterized protein (DUF1778 family)